jgi:hypothetical protein
MNEVCYIAESLQKRPGSRMKKARLPSVSFLGGTRTVEEVCSPTKKKMWLVVGRHKRPLLLNLNFPSHYDEPHFNFSPTVGKKSLPMDKKLAF